MFANKKKKIPPSTSHKIRSLTLDSVQPQLSLLPITPKSTTLSSIMKLQLSFKATKLRNIAGAFKGISDPFAVVTLLSNDRDAKPVVLGQTEM